MQPFDYQLRPRVVFGANSLEQLGSYAKQMQAHRVLVVSDPGVVRAGLFQRGCDGLLQANLEVQGFHDLAENPSTKHVELGLRVAKDFRPDLLVGLGGGSSMDCAKGINFVYSCGGRMQDYWGIGKANSPMMPMIAIPTTSGTGSETQSFALISDEETHVKMACGDPKAACKLALLDPTLTLSQPSSVTALTGIDAISHALETFVCNKRTPISECYSREAWLHLSSGFQEVLANPQSLEARSQMQLGACFAGMAIEASMLGAAHALANPLTAQLGVPHGQAVGVMLPHVIRFNGQVASAQYEELVKLTETERMAGSNAAEHLANLVEHWLQLANLATSLLELPQWPKVSSSSGFDQEELLLKLAQMASKQWTATFNPRPVGQEELLQMYQQAL
jgi:alcohol dehydrogenase